MDIFEQATESTTISKSGIKPKMGRPSKADILARKKSRIRTPITGEKSLLQVQGKKPGFEYYWVKDTDESGSEVIRYLSAGYEFVSQDEGIIVGENSVYRSKAVGSMIRIPAGREGDYLYLMKIPEEWYEEDKAAKARKVDKTEESIVDPNIEGKYGSIKIS